MKPINSSIISTLRWLYSGIKWRLRQAAIELAVWPREKVMKEYLVKRFSKNRWNLFADIDELFDY
ncbi:MAG: hypothetical protein ACYT04_76410 [Nostoc sp.]